MPCSALFSQGFRLALRVSARNIEISDDRPAAQIFVHFYDENRAPCGAASVGPWNGTFGWKKVEAEISIPARAKLAVLAVGLFGNTGELMIDNVVIEEGTGN